MFSFLNLPIFFLSTFYGITYQNNLKTINPEREKCSEIYKTTVKLTFFLIILDLAFIISLNLFKNVRGFLRGSKISV